MRSRIIFAALLTVAAAGGAQVPRIKIRVEKRADAQAQLIYARRLIADATMTVGKPVAERHAAVAAAVANLEAIERGWPDQRNAIIEANALMVQLYVDSGMPRNAVDAANHALAIAPDDSRVWVSLGKAQQRLGNTTAATKAFDEAAEKFNAGRGDYRDNVRVLNTVRFELEKQGQYARAATLSRMMAALRGASSIDKLLYLQGSLEDSLKIADHSSARRDLALMREAYAEALRESHNPMELTALNQAADVMRRAEALLR